MDLGVVSSPRISIGPAGCRINRDHARRGWATKTSHPSWGPRDPSQDKAGTKAYMTGWASRVRSMQRIR